MTIDIAHFSYGVGIPLLGYIVGAAYAAVTRMLSMSGDGVA